MAFRAYNWLHVGTTVSVTNVQSDVTIVAAPGAGLAIRVMYLAIAMSRSAAAGAFEGEFTEGLAGTQRIHWVTQQPNYWVDRIPLPEAGWKLPANTALGCGAIGTIAGPTVHRVTVGYVIEPA